LCVDNGVLNRVDMVESKITRDFAAQTLGDVYIIHTYFQKETTGWQQAWYQGIVCNV